MTHGMHYAIAPQKRSGIPAWGWTVIVMGALFVMCAGLTVLGALGKPRPMDVGPTPATRPTPTIAVTVSHAVGSTFRSGGFEYRVHGVERGLTQVGDEFSRQKAQGAFTRLDVTIRNVSSKPAFFDTDLRVKVEDKAGRRFSSDTVANLAGNSDQKGWFTEINPGNAIRAFAYFDLPRGTNASFVVVSAGLFSTEKAVVVPIG